MVAKTPPDSGERCDLVSLGVSIGNLEGRFHEFSRAVQASIERLTTEQLEASRVTARWREDTIRLQEQTRTRATLAAILALAVPVLVFVILAALEWFLRTRPAAGLG